MATCPICNAQVPDDFGLIECGSCRAQLLVHMDGRVEYSGAKEATGDLSEPIDDKTEVTAQIPDEKFEFGEALVELDLDKAGSIPDMEPTVLGQNQDLMGEADFSEQERRYGATREHGAKSESESEEESIAESDSGSDFDSVSAADPFNIIPEEAPAEVYKPSAGNLDSPDLSDIARFGNSEASSSRDGSLRYNLFISGIDTADVREAFREAVTDRKLVWDIDQILRSLKNGEVSIQNVPPPKAYILITRLRNLPVQVRWEQYAISQI